MTAGRRRAVTIAAMTRERLPWLDPALAAALTALGLLITFDPGNGDGTVVDSVVIGTVTIPVAWRLRAPLAAAAALAVGTVVSGVPTFDQIRCGVAIPAALLILFSLAARSEIAAALSGLALVLAGMVFLLFTDPQLDAGALFILPLCAGVWGAGRLVRSRSRIAAELEERSRRLASTREETARMAVEVERLQLATDIDVDARARVTELVELAGHARAALGEEPNGSRGAFARIERDGRDSLNQIRELLGVLRSDERDTSPRPTLAQIEDLLAHARAGGVVVELEVEGERRALPNGVELAAYRAVQHGLDALANEGTRPACVRLRYMADALELEVRGTVAADRASQAALAAARERVDAHGGSFTATTVAASGRVLWARLPLPATGG
jgi:signal transduction histidine kinase